MAGYVSVPLYLTLAHERIAQILTHSEARACFIGKLDGWDAISARTAPLQGQHLRDGKDLATIDLHLGYNRHAQGRDAQLRGICMGD